LKTNASRLLILAIGADAPFPPAGTAPAVTVQPTHARVLTAPPDEGGYPVRVLGRRTPATPASPDHSADVAADADAANPATAKKGRPTPKRSVAEKRRAPVPAPTNRRDAARLSRQQSAVKRNEARKGLVAGVESQLPARDRGPIRRYVRDWVDCRRTLAEFLLPLVFLFFVPLLFGTARAKQWFSAALDIVVIVIFLELATMLVLLRRALDREFPKGGPGRKGAMGYGAMRLAAVRMFRLPKPAVRRGGEPRPIQR